MNQVTVVTSTSMPLEAGDEKRLTLNPAEKNYEYVFGTFQEQLKFKGDPLTGLVVSMEYMIVLLQEWEGLLQNDLKQMLEGADEIDIDYWEMMQNNEWYQLSAKEYCETYDEIDTSSMQFNASDGESDGVSGDLMPEDEPVNEDYLSGQNTPIGSDDNMSIGSDDNMPDDNTLLNWIDVYVYINNHGEMHSLLQAMIHESGETLKELIDDGFPAKYGRKRWSDD